MQPNIGESCNTRTAGVTEHDADWTKNEGRGRAHLLEALINDNVHNKRSLADAFCTDFYRKRERMAARVLAA